MSTQGKPMIEKEKPTTAGTGVGRRNTFSTKIVQNSRGVDNLLQHFDKVRRTGPGTYLACCSAHEDRGPSLSIRERDDGVILLHCFAGCAVHDILAAVGLTMADLFPEPLGSRISGERRPFMAADALRCVAFEALVVSAAANALDAGKPLPPADRERLRLATRRLQDAATAAGVDRRG
jgi:hypothetical protein